MIFAELTLDEAEDTILARAVSAAALNLRKGTRLGRDHIAALRQAGVARVLAARLEDGDLGEDEAALRIGTMLARNVMNKGAMKDDAIAAGPATAGRVNLFACSDGVFCADVGAVDAINGHDARISLATLRNHVRVETGQMVATVKIIPFAVPERLVGAIGVRIGERRVLAVRTFRKVHIGLIQSRLPSIRETVLARTRDLMEKRAARSGGTIADEIRVAHEVEPLARAIAVLVADSQGPGWAAASGLVNNGPRAVRDAYGLSEDGSANHVNDCYCLTGGADAPLWGGAVPCGDECPSSGYAGRFVLVEAGHDYNPVFSNYGMVSDGRLTVRAVVQIQ